MEITEKLYMLSQISLPYKYSSFVSASDRSSSFILFSVNWRTICSSTVSTASKKVRNGVNSPLYTTHGSNKPVSGVPSALLLRLIKKQNNEASGEGREST